MSEEVKRLAPSKETLIRLFAYSGNQCAFPGCQNYLIDDEDNFIGQVCHIEAANEGGERFNKHQNNEDRRNFGNLMMMCYPHHVKTNNVQKYSVEILQGIKATHEKTFKASGEAFQPDEQIINGIYNDLLQSIKADTTIILQNTDIINEKNDVLIRRSDDIMDVLKQLVADKTPGSESNFDLKIDDILEFRDKNQQRVALDLFEQLRSRDWDKLNPKEIYRLLVSEGVCHLELFENESAAKCFIDAECFQPELVRAMTYAALGHALLEDEASARVFVNKALLIEPENIDAYVVLILLFKNDISFQDFVEKLPVSVKQNSQVAFALSRLADDQGHKDDAITWAGVAIDTAVKNQIDLKSNLATLVLDSIHDVYKIASGQANQDMINKARYVVQLYDESWEGIKGSDLHVTRSWWLLNRGTAKRILGDLGGCYDDILQACSYEPIYANYRQLAVTAMLREEYKRASEIMDQIEPDADDDQKNDIRFFRAEMYLLRKNPAEAVGILEDLLTRQLSPEIEKGVQECLLKAYERTGQTGAASELIDTMVARSPEEIIPWLYQAKRYQAEGDEKKVIASLEKAYLNVNKQSSPNDLWHLAKEFANLNVWDKAIGLMEKVTDISVFSPLSSDLLKIYHGAGETKKVLELCNDLISLYGPNHFLTEHLVVTYQHLNDMPNAVASCKQYLNVYPDDQRIVVRLALIYYKLNQIDKLREALVAIQTLDIRLPMDIQYKIAAMFFVIGDKERCFVMAYDIRKRYVDQQHAHELFVGLLMGFGNTVEHPADPSTVLVGSAATVSNGQRSITYVIRDRSVKQLLQEEIYQDSDIGSILIGKALGDFVEMDTDEDAPPYKLTALQHRYNYGWVESMRLLDERFIANRSFKKFRIGETGNLQEDFKPMFDHLNKAVERDQLMESMLAAGQLTIGSMATWKNTHPAKVLGNLTLFNSAGVNTTGGMEEFRAAYHGLDQQKGILFDIISLFTIDGLGIRDEIAKLPNKKAVSQSTVDQITELIRESTFFLTGSKSLIPRNDTFVLHEVTPEQIAKEKTNFENLQQWVTDNCEILPCYEAINMLSHEKRKLDELIGESFCDTILTAKEKGYMIYAEETNLRALAYTEHQIDGLYSFVFVGYLKNKGIVDQKRYEELVMKLIMMNFKLIPADSSLIIHAFEIYKDINHPVFVRTLTGLTSDMFSADQVLVSAGNLFIKLAENKIFKEVYGVQAESKCTHLIKACLNVITTKFNPLDAIRTNLTLNNKRFASLFPKSHSTVERLINEHFETLIG